ncbi:uroporphyrin-III methyltransferase [Paenibacillus yonginensis]|uniref:Uroporphyrinogen-III C-methyltransferase n=1 Tax=Paenibacillus yonginensis TaxID=1462996 RepID=A0A1B1MWP3_9BACL|nr:uroporphyrinogen-III C-methyltransferase [Paenibacillus yonginensis]ANS73588.1 uroporphyrin-III methyltransferase [Paenibacillus yonginensis]
MGDKRYRELKDYKAAGTNAGKVSIVGAGPGDPELITVKALRRLEEADLLLYDRLVNRKLLDYAKPEAVKIYCGKAPGRHTLPQEQIQALMVQHALSGKHVVRLKGGDPLVFGRGGEEALAMAKAGISYEIIPGITSALGAAASGAIPLTHRGISASCAFVTGSRCGSGQRQVRWDLLAGAVDTLVIYMGVGELAALCGEMLRSGKAPDTPAAIIERGTTAKQRILTGRLDQLDKLAVSMQAENPALIVIGEVVRVRSELLELEARMMEQTSSA